MASVIEWLNSTGNAFITFALPMLIQSTVLILLLLVVDLLLRRRVRAVFRYGLWMLVLAKLLLPPTLCAPTGFAYWLGDRLPDVSKAPASQPARMAADPVLSRPTPSILQAPAMTAPATTEPRPAAASPLTWQAVVLLAWLGGVTVLSLLLTQRLLFVRGLIAQSQPAHGSLVDILDACREQMRMGDRVTIKLSPNAASPSVCGLIRPVILMPQGLPYKLTAQHLRAILLHELAHIKRGDLWVSLIQTALQIFYFYNPLLWLANALIRRVREQAVDEMVLVALGDAAPDYPDTLLHVSKLSLARPALSLRLIGVVESKQTLKARIRHMVTRPFPKSARLGLLSLIALTFTAAALLPMAAAKNKSEQINENADHRYIATLSNGVTVQLLDLCELPNKDKQWWWPDGTPLDVPYNRSNGARKPEPGRQAYEMSILIKGMDNPEIEYVIPMTQGIVTSGNMRGGHKCWYCINFDVPEKLKSTEFKIGIENSQWTTISTIKADFQKASVVSGEQGGIVWTQPKEIDGETILVAMHKWKEKNVRIVAIGKDEKMYISGTYSLSDASGFETTRGDYFMPLSQIKEFQFQTRPYEWVTFKNVSLKTDSKTDVQIEVEKSTVQTINPGNDTTKNKPAKTSNRIVNDPPAAKNKAEQLVEKHGDPAPSGLLIENNEQSQPVSGVPSPEEIGGLVRNEKGEPIAGANIHLKNKALLSSPMRVPLGTEGVFMDSEYAVGKTDGDGHFRFTNLNPVKTDIYIICKGYQSAILRDISPGSANLQITLHPPARYTLSGQVVDGEGRSIPDVEIILAERSHRSSGLPKPQIITVHTGTDGTFHFPNEFQPLDAWGLISRTLIAQKQGYAVWGMPLDPTGAESSVQIALSPAHAITGRVLDSQGQSLADAEVWLWSLEAPLPQSEIKIDYFSMEELSPRAKTNEQGVFTLNGLHSAGKLWIFASCPGYARKMTLYQVDENDVEIRLQQGAILQGNAFYETTNNPAVGLKIRTQAHKTASWSLTTSDNAGRFELRDIMPESCNLFVDYNEAEPGQAPEWAVAAIKIDDLKPGEIQDNLKLILTKGGIVRGKVTDSMGIPLKNVDIAFYSAARPLSGAACQGTHTAENGTWSYRFPPGEVYVYIREQISDGKWSKSDYTLQLKEGQVIDNIDFVLNREVPENSPYRGTINPNPINDGQTQIESKNENTDGRYIPTLPNGATVESAAEQEGKNHAVNEESVIGWIMDGQGKPIAGASAAMITDQVGAELDNGKLLPQNKNQDPPMKIIQTDADGMFDFGANPKAAFSIVAADMTGGFAKVASADFFAERAIQLKPWGKIEGVRKTKVKVNEDSSIVLSELPYQNQLTIRSWVSCADDNRFIFERVPEGWYEVGYLVPTGKSRWSTTSRTPVEVKAGTTTQMNLGGEGRMVKGKFVAPAGYAEKVEFSLGTRALFRARPAALRPTNLPKEIIKSESFINKWNQYHHDPNWRHYTFYIEKDGAFQINDVIGGDYQLHVTLEKGDDRHNGPPEEIAFFDREIEIPGDSVAGDNPPVDLGELVLNMTKTKDSAK